MRGSLFARNQRLMVLCLIFFLQSISAAKLAFPESHVYKCTSSSGQVSFSQTGCEQGVKEPLVINNPEVGWINLKEVVAKFKANSDKDGNKRSKRKAPSSKSSDRARKQRCWRAQKKVARIERELKHGYKLARGEKLRYQRAEQVEYLALFCEESLP